MRPRGGILALLAYGILAHLLPAGASAAADPPEEPSGSDESDDVFLSGPADSSSISPIPGLGDPSVLPRRDHKEAPVAPTSETGKSPLVVLPSSNNYPAGVPSPETNESRTPPLSRSDKSPYVLSPPDSGQSPHFVSAPEPYKNAAVYTPDHHRPPAVVPVPKVGRPNVMSRARLNAVWDTPRRRPPSKPELVISAKNFRRIVDTAAKIDPLLVFGSWVIRIFLSYLSRKQPKRRPLPFTFPLDVKVPKASISGFAESAGDNVDVTTEGNSYFDSVFEEPAVEDGSEEPRKGS